MSLGLNRGQHLWTDKWYWSWYFPNHHWDIIASSPIFPDNIANTTQNLPISETMELMGEDEFLGVHIFSSLIFELMDVYD